MPDGKIAWDNLPNINSRDFRCGYCGADVACEKGFHGIAHVKNTNHHIWIAVCHKCTRPTFFDYDGIQYPGSSFGNTVSDIPDDSVRALYEETRRCISAGAFTSSILASRKLLMHIAVAKGAKAGDSFASYVDYLVDNHFAPPDAKEWVDHIRSQGNEATHEITIMKKEDAEELVGFLEMLLKFLYEFPAAMRKKHPKS